MLTKRVAAQPVSSRWGLLGAAEKTMSSQHPSPARGPSLLEETGGEVGGSGDAGSPFFLGQIGVNRLCSKRS